MFGIGKKIQDAITKAQTDPVGAMEDHKKTLNSGLTGFMTKTFMGKGFVDKMTGVMDVGQNALAGQQERLQLIQTGLDGTADILSVQDTGATVNNSPIVLIHMTVSPASGTPYDVNIQTMVSRIAVPRAGDKVKIKYAADNPEKVAIV
ncbi:MULTISPECIES: hypothetical protein [Paraburkholderia]|uniref:hypothetical protein n=1 Tax=Paraburkholderia TaxID=1822464 RepID=UPI0022503A97|nr:MULTISPECIES: hypothetical protein [Paraburkholderia]MCX4162230.1 hypothetical protein [Paraburkholderia megapolitana]MDN7157725.1 hypothetical protein [Paraburkholderia sp. CHISQ3]MDQ6494772.1 hypothetical protein [Paraburkholderia megapolitana]